MSRRLSRRLALGRIVIGQFLLRNSLRGIGKHPNSIRRMAPGRCGPGLVWRYPCCINVTRLPCCHSGLIDAALAPLRGLSCPEVEFRMANLRLSPSPNQSTTHGQVPDGVTVWALYFVAHTVLLAASHCSAGAPLKARGGRRTGL